MPVDKNKPSQFASGNGDVVNLLANGEKEIQIQEVSVTGKKSDNSTLDYLIFFNDRIEDAGDIITHRPNQGGSIGFWTSTLRNRQFDGVSYNRVNVRYYSSNWTGGGRAAVRTMNVAKFLEKGSIVGQVVLGAVELGQGVADDVNDYNTKGETKGKNTAVAAGSGAGTAIGVWFSGVGAVPEAVVGGIIGGALGSWRGSELGKAGVEKAYE